MCFPQITFQNKKGFNAIRLGRLSITAHCHSYTSIIAQDNLRKQVCIIVLGDYFTKWGEAYPTANKEANSVADLLRFVISWVGLKQPTVSLGTR